MARLQLGFSLPRSLTASAEVSRRLVRLGETLGYESVWVGEHIAMPRDHSSRYPFTDDGVPPFDHTVPYTEAMVTLAYLAGISDHITVGSAVIPIITRDPLSLAKQAATVDIVSDGRLQLGLGAGWLLEEATVLGRPSDHPVGRLRETVEIMRKGWTETAFEHHGRFYDFGVVGVHPQPVQSPVPIWIGGVSDALLAIALDHAEGVIVPARSRTQTVGMVSSVRERTSGKLKIAVIVLPGHDAEADLSFAAELASAGATQIIVNPSLVPDAAAEELARFRDAVRPLTTAA